LSKTIPVALKKLSDAVRVRRYSLRTEKAYLMWLRSYMEAVREYPAGMGSEEKVGRFLTG
jgi:hypothetical protein